MKSIQFFIVNIKVSKYFISFWRPIAGFVCQYNAVQLPTDVYSEMRRNKLKLFCVGTNLSHMYVYFIPFWWLLLMVWQEFTVIFQPIFTSTKQLFKLENDSSHGILRILLQIFAYFFNHNIFIIKNIHRNRESWW